MHTCVKYSSYTLCRSGSVYAVNCASFNNEKRKITQFFHQTTAKTNDGVVEPVCRADPGGSDVEFQNRELLFPAGDVTDIVYILST